MTQLPPRLLGSWSKSSSKTTTAKPQSAQGRCCYDSSYRKTHKSIVFSGIYRLISI
jgi:hypothetical protein